MDTDKEVIYCPRERDGKSEEQKKAHGKSGLVMMTTDL